MTPPWVIDDSFFGELRDVEIASPAPNPRSSVRPVTPPPPPWTLPALSGHRQATLLRELAYQLESGALDPVIHVEFSNLDGEQYKHLVLRLARVLESGGPDGPGLWSGATGDHRVFVTQAGRAAC